MNKHRHLFAALILSIATSLAASPATGASPAPKTLAAYTLGRNVSEFTDHLDMGSDQTIWNQEWFKQVEVKGQPGFEGGYLIYGNCLEPGRVLRIKLKYADDSLGFFDRLQKALQDRYGQGEWRGDPFGTLRTWKWGFTDERGDSISLILQHYSGEETSYTDGNSIRLANRTAMLREKACGESRPNDKGTGQAAGGVPSFDWYLPR